MEEQKESFGTKIKSWNWKKIIKSLTLGFGLLLIVFMSFFNAIFDFANFKFNEWLANFAVLVGIMIFGILMGNSVGTDVQKEKVGGLFQTNCNIYNDTYLLVDGIRIFFAQFWLWYKERKLVEKKLDYLINNQFDGRVAKVIVNNIEKEDMVVGKFIFDETKPNEKIYVKELENGELVKLKKVNVRDAKIVSEIFAFKLDTFDESYYLSLFDDGDVKVNEAERGKKISQKIKRDKRNAYILKITSSLVISIVWSAITIQDFMNGDPSAIKKAWLNLISRLTALITSFVSGYTTSVVNVRDQARAIENKTHILKDFKYSYDNKMFPIETYEEMIEREYQEQKEYEKAHQVEVEVIDKETPIMLDMKTESE